MATATAGACGVCLQAAGLRRRDLGPLCALGQMSDGTHYTWICQFCWRRATQCIKFIERVRNAEQLLESAHFDDQKTNIHNLTKIALGPYSICKYKACQSYTRNSVIVEKIAQSTKKQLKFETIEVEKIDIEVPETLSVKSETELCKIEESSVKEEMNQFDNNDVSDHSFAYNTDYTDHSPAPSHKYDIETADEAVKTRASRKRSDVKKQAQQRGSRKRDQKPTRKQELLKMVENKCVKLDYTKEDQMREIEIRKSRNKYIYSKYKCEKCGLSFNDSIMYEQHLQKHDESAGSFECEVCKYRFACVKVYNKHLTSHKRRWRCLKCSAILMALDKCVKHYEICSNSAQPSPCDVCGKVFRSPFDLKKHKNTIHDLKKRFKCEECNKSFKYKHMLRKHVLAHTGWSAYECEICGKKSMDLYVHKQHIKLSHGQKEMNEDSYCVECDMYFKSKHHLKQHLNKSLKHVTKDTYKHGCSQCPDRFPVASQLQLHIRTVHLRERTHHCTVCNKGYFTSGAVTSHMKRIHADGERPRNHVCAICGKAFYAKPYLQRHIVAIHNKERPYACTFCPATFGYSAALYTHTKNTHGAKAHCSSKPNEMGSV